MKTFGIVMAGAVGLFALVLLIIGGMWISAVRAETRLRNAFHAQEKANESTFDKMWKVISQQAQIPVKERETFRQTYVEIMQATKGVAGNGQLASFFTQAKIDIPSDLFRKLMTTIEAQRESFNESQLHLVQLKRQHDDVRTMPPSSWFVGYSPELELKLVSSLKTMESFSTGEDNDTTLFPKEKQ